MFFIQHNHGPFQCPRVLSINTPNFVRWTITLPKRLTKTTMCTQVFLHKNRERKTVMTPFFNFYFLAHVFTLQYTLHIVTVRIYWQQYSIQLNMDYTLHISAKFPVNLEAAKGAWVWCTCLGLELRGPMARSTFRSVWPFGVTWTSGKGCASWNSGKHEKTPRFQNRFRSLPSSWFSVSWLNC